MKKGNGFVTVLKNNVIYVEFGSCYGDRYCKGTYKIKADTLIATITQEDKSERKSNKYIPITPFDLKFLIRPKLLICSNCPSPTKVDTIWFSRPVFQKSK
ncbi:MAG: hypothetical protein Q7W45_03100 [Bacteroidota bacterium]|nr:hypothetical protein [Bacteroidota bacterium]